MRAANEYKENTLYARIGESLIREEDCLDYIREHEIRIRYLESNKPAGKSKRVKLGECRMIKEKTKDMFRALGFKEEEIPDFVIVIYKERIFGFHPEQLRILIMHELMHIGVKEDSETGEITLHTAKHDLEDFRYIIERFGTGWADDRNQITWQQVKEAFQKADERTEKILQQAEKAFQKVDEETGEIMEG